MNGSTDKPHCDNLGDLLRFEKIIINNCLEGYMKRTKIQDREQAKVRFIEDYASLVRHIYCNHNCKYRSECEVKLNID